MNIRFHWQVSDVYRIWNACLGLRMSRFGVVQEQRDPSCHIVHLEGALSIRHGRDPL